MTTGAELVAAGAWTAGLLGKHLTLPPLTVTQQDTFHFRRLDPAAPAWPSVLHERGDGVHHLAGGRDGGPDGDRKILTDCPTDCPTGRQRAAGRPGFPDIRVRRPE
ncbi:hypothetical protein [Streptomyces sp. NPDC051662]|uniref:hypothetical protein n=1 Tax=Streptomyces sp. NPDC051662 TaxID=3154750 RepID=UPI00341EDF29